MTQEEELKQLRLEHKRVLDAVLKMEHIIGAYMEIASPASKPYAEVLQKIIKEITGE